MSQILGLLQYIFRVSEFLGVLWSIEIMDMITVGII